jgi:hypothetical protein
VALLYFKKYFWIETAALLIIKKGNNALFYIIFG